MSMYLAAGAGVPTGPIDPNDHLPSSRTRHYPSDTTDEEWVLLAPLLPTGRPSRRGGRPAQHSRRDIIDAIRYVAHNGCVWRALPVDFPPWQTVYRYHAAWTRDGTVTRIHNTLREQVRQAEDRAPDPTGALVDSQSIRAAETVAHTSRGYDGGKKINGRKRHIATDTIGLLLVVLITAASVQDRDGGRSLLWALRCCFPTVTKVWADGGYAGQLVHWATRCLHLGVEIVHKLADQVGFQVLHLVAQ